MIRAYDEDMLLWQEPDLSVSRHIGRSVLSATPVGVKAAVFSYLTRHNPSQAVCETLGRITSDPVLLAKTRVVRDRRYGNAVILVTPQEAAVTVGGIRLEEGTCDLEATMRYWARSAEAILIELAPEGVREERRPLGESMEVLLHWNFQKLCKSLRS